MPTISIHMILKRYFRQSGRIGGAWRQLSKAVGGAGLPIAGTPAGYPANYSDQATPYGDLSYAQARLQVTPCNPPASISQHSASSSWPATTSSTRA